MDFGLIACRRALPDLGTLADYIEAALAELDSAVARKAEELAAPPAPAAAPKRKSRARPGTKAAARASAPAPGEK